MVIITQNGNEIIENKVETNVKLLADIGYFLYPIEYVIITDASGAANIMAITVKPTKSNFHTPVSFSITAKIIAKTNPIICARITFIIIPYQTFLSCIASRNFPFAKVIPITNHANGVHNHSNVFVILNNGGKVLYNRNGENNRPLPILFWSGTISIPGINCVTQKINPIIVAIKIGLIKICFKFTFTVAIFLARISAFTCAYPVGSIFASTIVSAVVSTTYDNCHCAGLLITINPNEYKNTW